MYTPSGMQERGQGNNLSGAEGGGGGGGQIRNTKHGDRQATPEIGLARRCQESPDKKLTKLHFWRSAQNSTRLD